METVPGTVFSGDSVGQVAPVIDSPKSARGVSLSKARGQQRSRPPRHRRPQQLWTQIGPFGRNLDASNLSFASNRKPQSHNDLTAIADAFGRFGRKIPEHFMGDPRC